MTSILQYVKSQTVILSSSNLSEYINIDTLFGAVVVLAILVFILLVQYLTKIKPFLNDSNPSQGRSVDHVISQIAENEELELSDNYELVAVITAAIYASYGDAVPADGFVVRSIRKSNRR